MRYFLVQYRDADLKFRVQILQLSQAYTDRVSWDNRPLYFQRAVLGYLIVNKYHNSMDHVIRIEEQDADFLEIPE